MANYYCMMAGLPDLRLADSKPAVSIAELKEECEESLSPADRRLMFFFFLRKDCLNIVRLLKDPDAELEPYGNFTADQYQDMITSARELTFNVHRYPAFMSIFIRDYNYNKEREGYFPEDAMLYEYYRYCLANCKNRMMREWYGMNLNVANILTAMIARKNGWNVGNFIQGDNEVTEMIRTNNTKDFDLGYELDYVKKLMPIVDEPDPVQKERRIDAFKWLWLDEQTFFNPFNIDAVFAYFCKLDILHRWETLDPERGRETFERIIDELRGEARVPAEFVRK